MKITLCTLFDSNYLDKGIALYKSLEKVSDNFVLYVLAMDEICENALKQLGYKNLIPISLSKFETEDLIKAKTNRSFAEYCWTCSSSLIKYIFEEFSPENCTYVDADVYFYQDPRILIQELHAKNCSVLVTGHRFNWYEKDTALTVGKYCVEFNTFKNDDKARMLLDKWASQCLEACFRSKDGIHFGDQMYIDGWCTEYPFVYETHNLGAGIAPWNIRQYKLLSIDKTSIRLSTRSKSCDLVFFHFENIQYIERNKINIAVYKAWGIDENLVTHLYSNYLHLLDSIKSEVYEKFNFIPLVNTHPAISKKKKSKIIAVLSNIRRPIKFIMCTIPSYIYRNKNIMFLK